VRVLVGLAGSFVPLSIAVSKVPGGTYPVHVLLLILVARAWSLVAGWVPRLRVPSLALVALAAWPLASSSWALARHIYRPIPVLPLARAVVDDPGFSDACFAFDTDERSPNGFRLDALQFSFFSRHCAYLVESHTDDEVGAFIREAGLVPYLVLSGDRCGMSEGAPVLSQPPYCVFPL
jgi:hypothetical protein